MILDRIQKVFLTVLIFLSCNSLYSQKYSCYYDGFWGDWDSYSGPYTWGVQFHGGYGGFVVFEKHKHPSEYFFVFKITGYSKPTKKEIKEHRKTNTWWVYNGQVEYYICDVYPTFGDCLKHLKRPLLESDTKGSQYEEKLLIVRANQINQTGRFNKIGLKRVVKNATIRIAPYKEHPRVYNIFFEGIGYAIDLEDTYFMEK